MATRGKSKSGSVGKSMVGAKSAATQGDLGGGSLSANGSRQGEPSLAEAVSTAQQQAQLERDTLEHWSKQTPSTRTLEQIANGAEGRPQHEVEAARKVLEVKEAGKSTETAVATQLAENRATSQAFDMMTAQGWSEKNVQAAARASDGNDAIKSAAQSVLGVLESGGASKSTSFGESSSMSTGRGTLNTELGGASLSANAGIVGKSGAVMATEGKATIADYDKALRSMEAKADAIFAAKSGSTISADSSTGSATLKTDVGGAGLSANAGSAMAYGEGQTLADYNKESSSRSMSAMETTREGTSSTLDRSASTGSSRAQDSIPRTLEERSSSASESASVTKTTTFSFEGSSGSATLNTELGGASLSANAGIVRGPEADSERSSEAVGSVRAMSDSSQAHTTVGVSVSETRAGRDTSKSITEGGGPEVVAPDVTETRSVSVSFMTDKGLVEAAMEGARSASSLGEVAQSLRSLNDVADQIKGVSPEVAEIASKTAQRTEALQAITALTEQLQSVDTDKLFSPKHVSESALAQMKDGVPFDEVQANSAQARENLVTAALLIEQESVRETGHQNNEVADKAQDFIHAAMSFGPEAIKEAQDKLVQSVEAFTKEAVAEKTAEVSQKLAAVPEEKLVAISASYAHTESVQTSMAHDGNGALTMVNSRTASEGATLEFKNPEEIARSQEARETASASASFVAQALRSVGEENLSSTLEKASEHFAKGSAEEIAKAQEAIQESAEKGFSEPAPEKDAAERVAKDMQRSMEESEVAEAAAEMEMSMGD